MSFSQRMIGWLVALAILVLRATCRVRVHDDPRPALRAASESYAYSVLHAHQIATVIDGERGTAAMVSRSADGDLLVPGLRAVGITPFRGSNRGSAREKGGRTALAEMVTHVLTGCPAYLAVDGPRGPRNHVHKGIAVLSKRTGAAVLTLVAVPTRRWILTRAWDRFQIPKPFCTIHAYFGEPLRPRTDEDVEQYRKRIERALNQLEACQDPQEAPSTC